MKLVALTYGTEGDTRPIAVLCRALMDAGHAVELLADAGTLGSARRLGVPHAALSGDVKEDLKALVSEGKGVNATVAGLARIANAQAQSWMQQTAEAASDCDGIVVSGLAAFVGLSVAERFRIPLIGAGMIPISPTRAFASPFLPPGKLPAILNRPSHHLVNWMLWLSFRKATNRARKRVLGLGPRHGLWTGHPMLYGVSPELLPAPRDWPANAALCGQWLEPADSWHPPPELQAFLEAGEPPVYLGFGSMVGFDRETLWRDLARALAGRRVLVNPGWAGLPVGPLPDGFLVIGDTPHAWLFPRTSLAIHHGGSGTAHSACRAGVPSIVLPFAGDQFFWSHQLHRLGVAGPALSAGNLSPEEMQRALRFASSGEARHRAAMLGRRMSRENGTAVAVAKMEAMLAGRGGEQEG